MAGAFGYNADTYDLSMQMGGAQLFPKIAKAEEDTVLVADGTSCRCQIADGTGRQAKHVAHILAEKIEAEK